MRVFQTKALKRQPIKGQCRRLRRASVQRCTAILQHQCPAACCLQGSTELNDVGMHQNRPSRAAEVIEADHDDNENDNDNDNHNDDNYSHNPHNHNHNDNDNDNN